MSKKIHYKHPGKQFAICDKAGHNPDLRIDIKAVTCRTCQRMVTGKTWSNPDPMSRNPVGRPVGLGGRRKISVVVTDKAYVNFRAIKELNRSQTISNFLENIPSGQHHPATEERDSSGED